MNIKSKKSISIVCLIGFLFSMKSIAAEPVAIVTDLQGTATIELAGDSNQINILDNFEADSTVVVAEGNALTVVYYESGVEYAYTGPVSFVVGVAQPQMLAGDAGQSTGLKLLESTGLKPAERNLNQAATVFRAMGGSGSKIELLNPVNTKIMETSPVFNWLSLSEETSYNFVLKSSRGQTVFQNSVTQNEVQLPKGIELRYGRKYNWEVTARVKDESYRATASFQMGSESNINNLSQHHPDTGSSFSEKMVYALLLKQNGFEHAAQQAWKALKQERPNYSKESNLFEQ
ncbi:MAG: hypothetical protein ACI9WC_001796 [Arenicella sp.]|jgi:hypothetical protein